MTLLPLHLVVKLQIFTTNSIYHASIASHGKNWSWPLSFAQKILTWNHYGFLQQEDHLLWGTVWCTVSTEILSTAAQLCEKCNVKVSCRRVWPWTSLQSSELLIATSFTVYMTACDIARSFTFDNTVEITSPMHFLIVHKHITFVLYESERLQSARVIFKSRWVIYWCRLIGHTISY